MDSSEFDRRMGQLMTLFEKVITQNATQQPVVVNVNLDSKKKKASVGSDPANEVEAVEPGGQPRPYPS